jgi:hypothetical protein
MLRMPRDEPRLSRAPEVAASTSTESDTSRTARPTKPRAILHLGRRSLIITMSLFRPRPCGAARVSGRRVHPPPRR